jgi:hypothetical protein
MAKFGLDASGLGYTQMAGSFENGNEPSVSIKGCEFPDQPNGY